MNAGGKDKVFKDVLLFELITTLCFIKNTKFLNNKNKDYQLLSAIKNGSATLALEDANISPDLSKFLVGLFLFGFFIYENIGQRFIFVSKMDNSSLINAMFFDGESIVFDAQRYDKEMRRFFTKSLRLLFAMDTDKLSQDIFVRLADMFDSTKIRLQKEAGYLEKIIKAENITVKIISKENFNVNVFSILMASMPAAFINSFFMLLGMQMDADVEVQTVNGIKINAQTYFSYNTSDIHELYNKIKVLLHIYINDKAAFMNLISDPEIVKYLELVLKDGKNVDQIRKHINDTLEGQFYPRVKTIEAFQKVIS